MRYVGEELDWQHEFSRKCKKKVQMSGTLQEAQSFKKTRLSMGKKKKRKITLVSKEEEEVLKDALRQGKVAERFVWEMDQGDNWQAADTDNALQRLKNSEKDGEWQCGRKQEN